MPQYIMLVNFTDQGLKGVKDGKRLLTAALFFA